MVEGRRLNQYTQRLRSASHPRRTGARVRVKAGEMTGYGLENLEPQ